MATFTLRDPSGGSALQDGNLLRGVGASEITPLPFSILTNLDTLGCGVWRAFIQQVGGTGQFELNYNNLTTGIRLSDSSQATITLTSANLNTYCCDILADIYPFQYELILYRNSEQAFIGPIVNATFTRTTITLTAQDMFYWLEKRVLDQDLGAIYTDLSNLFKLLFNMGMAQDPIPNLQLITQDTGKKGSRDTAGGEFVRIADSMRELAKTGLEFTTIGYVIYTWGVGESPFPDLPPLISDDFSEELTLQLAGAEYGNDIIVTGNSASDTGYPYFGRATNWESSLSYPLITQTFSESNISNKAILTDSARSRLERFRANPVLPTGAFSPHAHLTYSQLVPGIECNLALEVGCRVLIDRFKLEGVDVTVSTEDSTEAITPRFVPIGIPLVEPAV